MPAIKKYGNEKCLTNSGFVLSKIVIKIRRTSMAAPVTQRNGCPFFSTN
jgi:hypothetical protein